MSCRSQDALCDGTYSVAVHCRRCLSRLYAVCPRCGAIVPDQRRGRGCLCSYPDTGRNGQASLSPPAPIGAAVPLAPCKTNDSPECRAENGGAE